MSKTSPATDRTVKGTKKRSVPKAKRATSYTARTKAVRKTAKTTKTAVKKTTAQKVTAPKKAAKKRVRKTAVKKTASATKTTVPAPTVPVVSEETPVLSPIQTIQVWSPHRFSVPVDLLAIQMARFGGLALVILGGVAAVWSATYLHTGAIPGLAATTNQATVCEAGAVCEEDNHGSSGTYEPPVEFLYNAGSVEEGVVNLRVQVDAAENVQFSVYDRSNDEMYELGAGTLTNHDTWELPWPSPSYPDSEYKVIVMVSNQFGTYEAVGEYFVVENNPAASTDEPEEDNGDSAGGTNDATDHDDTHEESDQTDHNDAHDATGDTADEADHADSDTDQSESDAANSNVTETIYDETTNTDDETDYADTTPELAAEITRFESVEGDVLVGVARFELETEAVDSVSMKLVRLDDLTTVATAQAYQHDTDRWRHVLDSARYSDGVYQLHAQAFVRNDLVDTTHITFEINNAPVETGTSTVESTATDSTGVTEEGAESLDLDVLDPELTVQVLRSDTTDGVLPVFVSATGVEFVELHVQPEAAATAKFVGLATQVDESDWRFRFDTSQIPNGSYQLFAKTKNQYGEFISDLVPVEVYNQTPLTAQLDTGEAPPVNPLTQIPAEDISLLPTTGTDTPSSVTEAETEAVTDSTLVDDEQEVPTETLVDELLNEYKDDLEAEFRRLAAALRSQDEAAVDRVKGRLEELKRSIIEAELSETEQKQLVDRIDDKLRGAIVRIEEHVKITEKIVAERTGESAAKDTDQDGITDFDEVNIYNTDPESADSDGDGFIDGAEILSGFNPTDSTPEALVTFESPKDSGIVREDILVVEDVVAVTTQPEDGDGVAAGAVITGKALPNSFVTIYIFSTPVVITVKTDADGTWQYRFEKELEDGEHEVYVGVTDNTGQIIAKSEPFVFVKEAEAFTPVDTAAGAPVTPVTEPTIFSQYLVYLIVSISVVVIGLMLILLGLQLDRRRLKVASKPVPTPVEPQPVV